MGGVDRNLKYPDRDQRREPRFPTFFFANLKRESGEPFMEGTVRDISKNGAQVRIKSTDGIPSRLIIVSMSDNSQKTAVVRWLNGASIGLEFCR